MINHIHGAVPQVFLSYTIADALVPYSNYLNLVSRLNAVGHGPKLKSELSDYAYQSLFPITLNTPAQYFPHSYMWAIGALGKEFYYKEQNLRWSEPDPPKDLARMLKITRKKQDPLIELLQGIAHDSHQYLDAKGQLHSIDKNLRQWIFCEAAPVRSECSTKPNFFGL